MEMRGFAAAASHAVAAFAAAASHAAAVSNSDSTSVEQYSVESADAGTARSCASEGGESAFAGEGKAEGKAEGRGEGTAVVVVRLVKKVRPICCDASAISCLRGGTRLKRRFRDARSAVVGTNVTQSACSIQSF